uniref:Uncharacterized protein n=1 Tax=Brugia timori TaxID=42155 RepID=A0A0R3QHJ8_9BILA
MYEQVVKNEQTFCSEQLRSEFLIIQANGCTAILISRTCNDT